MRFNFKILSLLIFLTPVPSTTFAEETPIISFNKRFNPQIARHGMVASQEKIATEVGLAILRQGGNAIDAAVAVGFTLAVTFPQAGNLGGGGFMLVYLADKNKTFVIDYREAAPQGAFRQLFLNPDGSVNNTKSRYSYLSAGIPGTVAGLTKALNDYGTMSLKQVIGPAIKLATKGFIVSYALQHSFSARKDFLSRHADSKKIFLKADGTIYQAGDRFIQSDLGKSLKQIKKHGAKAFYQGAIAKKIVAAMADNDGLINTSDLNNYKVIERKPVTGTYKQYTIASMPPPSSGGVHLLQMLNTLETIDLKKHGHNSAQTLHLYIESMRQAYADRSKYLGDPDFSNVPVAALISQSYADKIRAQIPWDHARSSAQIAPALEALTESNNTTHFSVMDQYGNVVSNTYTLNFSYGSGIVVPGTGILLNNEMDDFSAKPGSANAYGLIGGEANAIEAGKRPLSSMTPTIVFENNKPLLATGSPGGSTIITAVLQTLLNVMAFDMNIAEATTAPRIHHQWFPDNVEVESGISPDTITLLENMGHQIIEGKRALGSTQSIMAKEGYFYGFSDTRRPGASTAGY
ncbi:MAG: gamma-glutamyltransferase [Pseudomonadales bacterium]